MMAVQVNSGSPVVSVIVPAFNEALYLGGTLDALAKAAAVLRERHGVETETIVVDNASTDATASVARSFGASVVEEAEHNIARARNRGAASARGRMLVFVDADTLVPPELLARIHECPAEGGAIDTDYRPAKRSVRVYLALWRIAGCLAGLAQGATQFCRRDVFDALGGYDESLYMGEDVDFYARLKRRGSTLFIDDLKVAPSCRRFDRWPLWRTLLWTNPLVGGLCRGTRRVWRDWYERPVR